MEGNCNWSNFLLSLLLLSLFSISLVSKFLGQKLNSISILSSLSLINSGTASSCLHFLFLTTYPLSVGEYEEISPPEIDLLFGHYSFLLYILFFYYLICFYTQATFFTVKKYASVFQRNCHEPLFYVPLFSPYVASRTSGWMSARLLKLKALRKR